MYFKDFPLTTYSFGSGELPVAFTSMDVYVDIVDQIKDELSTYRYYYIQDGDRPDNVAQRLYDDQSYYWTFFMMNDHLKESGWPLSEKRLVEKVKQDHPDYVVSTRDSLVGKFKLGQTITGSQSGSKGTIVFRNLDLGQLFIRNATGPFFNDEVVTSQVGAEVQSITLFAAIDEFNSVDHYIDGDGKQVDIDPYSAVSSSITPVTKIERYRALNDDLKRIRVLRPEVAAQVAAKFQEELRS